MRHILALLLVLILAACAAPPVTPTGEPTETVVLPTQTPMVVVETVVVTVIPTDLPTEIPSATPMPPPTEVPPTLAPPTQPPAATETSAPQVTNNSLVSLDNALGAGWFSAMALTANTLSLRCKLYDNVTFSVTPSDPNISQVDFYYRIEDRATGAVFDWQGPRRMLAGPSGDFNLVFRGEDVNANFRKPNAWLDFQFIGLNKGGGRIGNSEKIIQQLNYTFDCP